MYSIYHELAQTVESTPRRWNRKDIMKDEWGCQTRALAFEKTEGCSSVMSCGSCVCDCVAAVLSSSFV